MEQASLHTELKSRLKALASHIDELSQMMDRAKGDKRLEDKNEIETLKRRYTALDDELHGLDLEGPDFQQGVKTKIEAGANELTRWIEEHMAWVDSGYRTNPRSKQRHNL
jgi:uncharacterized protein YdcH (DUF465 family)